uniref:Uncharacterized protein n=1 Tax=Synechocystis sp. PCC 9413 TaxID=77760 RepID=A0A2P0ZGE7_9SYNC|nr:hypothetical protein [Synechocystis sp. PCC 9413]
MVIENHQLLENTDSPTRIASPGCKVSAIAGQTASTLNNTDNNEITVFLNMITTQ